MRKIIHQIAITNGDISRYVPPNKESINKHFLEYKYMFWDYKKIKSLMVKNNDLDVLNAMEGIKPYSFKADIAKYYLVYKLGGIYVDLNVFFEKPIDIENNSFIFFKDMQAETMSSWAVASGLFYSDVKNEVLLDAVKQCVINVKNKYYGGHPLCPTGPNLFGGSIAKYNLPEDNSYKIGVFKKISHTSVFEIDQVLIAKYKTNGLDHGNSGLPAGNHYGDMWNNRQVY